MSDNEENPVKIKFKKKTIRNRRKSLTPESDKDEEVEQNVRLV